MSVTSAKRPDIFCCGCAVQCGITTYTIIHCLGSAAVLIFSVTNLFTVGVVTLDLTPLMVIHCYHDSKFVRWWNLISASIELIIITVGLGIAFINLDTLS